MAAKPSPSGAAKKTAVKPIPEGRPRVSPYLVTKEADRVIDFLERVVGATVEYRLADPAGKVMHAEVRIGDSVVMVSDGSKEHPPAPATLHVYVEDVDTTHAAALAAGATEVRAPEDQFYGDRSGGVRDHAGNQWWFSTHVEDVSIEEIARRAASAKKKG
jgi:uncharacterized glyoxalase superfamily protein PhnB